MVLIICMYYYIVFNYLFLYLSLDAPFCKTDISLFVNYILLLLVLESSLCHAVILLVEFYYIHAHFTCPNSQHVILALYTIPRRQINLLNDHVTTHFYQEMQQWFFEFMSLFCAICNKRLKQ